MITKTRSGTTVPADTSTATVVKFGSCSGTTNTVYAGAPSYVPFEETITYAPRGFGRYNSCDHLRVRKWYSTSPAKGTASLTNPPSGCSSTETWSKAGVHSYAWTNSMWPQLTYDDANWRSYSGEALRAMWPEVESLMSTLNFTWELPEVRRLVPDMLRLAGLSRKGVQTAMQSAMSGGGFRPLANLLPFRLRKKTLRQLAKEIKDHPLDPVAGLSQGTLIYYYGIKPLISDLAHFGELSTHVAQQVRRLKRGANLLHKSHFFKQCAVSASSYDDAVAWSGGSPSQGEYRAGRDYTSLTARYSATMSYSWSLPSMSEKRLKTLAYLDALGIQANPAIVWDAIPYSFLLDWVLDVSDILEAQKKRNLDPVVTIHGFCHSYKRHYRLVQDIFLRANRTPSYGRYLVKSEEVKRYTRETATPVLTDPVLRVGSITKLKVVLGSALIGARLKSR